MAHRVVLVGTLLLPLLAACSRPAESPARAPAAAPSTGPDSQPAVTGEPIVTLPMSFGPWSRPPSPRRVTAEGIFDYMDGGGELYLAYGFDHLEVYEYKAADASQGTILVEVYLMKSSDDAFGLLSTDWGGEAVSLGGVPPAAPAAVPPSRALYGAGLLRMWSGDVYARVLASRETPQSRQAVLDLGRAIAAGRQPAAPPAFLSALAPLAGGGRALRKDRTCFFRSYLVLNAAFYLASEDILGLDGAVEGLTTEIAPAAGGGRPVRVVIVRYPGDGAARKGLESFRRAYLAGAPVAGGAGGGAARVEQGWVAWIDRGRDVVLVLDAPDAASARSLAALAGSGLS